MKRTEHEIGLLLREYDTRCKYLSEMLRIERERSRVAHARVVGEVGRICAVFDQLRALGYNVDALAKGAAS